MKVIIGPQFQSARSFIESIPERFDSEGILVDNRRNTLKIFDSQWGQWIIKRYRKPSGFQRFVYTFIRKPKSERAFLYASRLVSLGIDSPTPVADIQTKDGPLFSYGYFVCELTKDPCVSTALEKTDEFDVNLADAVADFIAETHRKGVRHGDLNLTNIMFRQDPQGWHFSYIDTNRCRFRSGELSMDESLHDLRRVTHNKDLYRRIVTRYSQSRGWNPDEVLDLSRKKLEGFERWERLKKWWKTTVRESSSPKKQKA